MDQTPSVPERDAGFCWCEGDFATAMAVPLARAHVGFEGITRQPDPGDAPRSPQIGR